MTSFVLPVLSYLMPFDVGAYPIWPPIRLRHLSPILPTYSPLRRVVACLDLVFSSPSTKCSCGQQPSKSVFPFVSDLLKKEGLVKFLISVAFITIQ